MSCILFYVALIQFKADIVSYRPVEKKQIPTKSEP